MIALAWDVFIVIPVWALWAVAAIAAIVIIVVFAIFWFRRKRDLRI